MKVFIVLGYKHGIVDKSSTTTALEALFMILVSISDNIAGANDVDATAFAGRRRTV